MASAPPLPASVGGGRYTPRRLLGEGARKRVYLALDERLGREVAVAVVKTEGLDEQGRARISREARSMARLGDHPLIVTVFDVGDDSGTPFIVAQYMPGGSLAERLEAAPDHRLPMADVLTAGEQVARALEHAHGHGIVHRDLKPANVWIDADGNTLLGDFGLAVPLDVSRMTAEGLVVGTVAYLAPEQALGREPDPRADLYSLGALLYECLCGRPPFLGDDAVAVISQHLNTQPVAPSWHNAGVPAGLDALVTRLLAKDPGERPGSAAEVAAELARLHSELDSHPPQAVAEPRRRELLQAEWGRFIGRSDEMAAMRSAFDDVLSGRTRIVMVVGEPGVGKTRLVEELGAYASMRGAQVCWGHSYEGEVGLPYLPFVEAFRTYVRDAPDAALTADSSAGLAEVATLVSDLRQRLPQLPDLPPLEGDAERLRLFEGVAAFLRSATGVQPLVLVLDDLHWADKPSLLLLQHLARSLRHARLLLVGTYRDVELERTHPLADVIANLRRQRLYERVLLRGLPRDQVKAMIEAIGGQETPAQFADLIYRETEGNPFFVHEILRHLVDTGALRRQDGAWVGTPDAVVANLPEGVREVIGRRLDSLSAQCNEMLTVAAAMPSGFTVELVGDVAEIEEDRMLDLLDEALGAQVVRERRERPGTYELGHALIRQTLYGELSTPRRVRLHRRITEALEARYADSIDSRLPELAYHANEAAPGGDVAKAVDYAGRAATRAMGQAAYEEAARYHEMALQALDLMGQDVAPSARIDVLVALGRALGWAGDAERSHAICVEAADLARAEGDAMRLAQAAAAYMGLQTASGAGEEDTVLTGLLEEAAAGLQALDPDDEHADERDAMLAEVLTRLSAHLTFRQAERAAVLADEAVELASRAGDPGRHARALLFSTWRGWADEDRLRRVQEQIVELASRAGDLSLVMLSLENLLGRAVNTGERDEVDSVVADIHDVAQRSRAPRYLTQSASNRAGLAALDGRYAEAEQLFFEVLRLARPIGDPTLIANVGIGLAPVYRELGRLGDLEEPTRRAVAGAPDIPAYRAGLVQILVETGQLDEAQAELDDLVARGEEGLPVDVSRRYHLSMLAEAAERTGDVDAARAVYEWLEADNMVGNGVMLGPWAYHGALHRYRGLLAGLLGRHDDAVVQHQLALETHERLRAPGWVARSRYDLARALVARDGDGDRARAGDLVNQAVQVAHELGMVRLLEDAMAVKLGLQGVSRQLSPGASIDAVSVAVGADRPDLASHAGVDGHVTVCFSDIEGYSAMTDRLGDARTHEVLKAHNEILRQALFAHGGTEVKSEGDGFMLVFGEARRALAFCRDMQRRLREREWPDDVGAVRVRMGMHRGEVIRDAEDFFGRTVIVGARVAAQAAGGEVLVTDAVRDAAGASFEFGPVRQLDLKGLREPQAAHPLVT